jgi:F-type H+-transporting ATPase subunit delta
MATVTSTYARAFADVVFIQHLDPVNTLREAKALVALVEESKELRKVWDTPSISAGQKRSVLDAIAVREQLSKPVRNFMAVLIDHHRVEFLAEIVRQFELEINQRLGFTEAEVTSARDLGESERHSLEAELEKLTGNKVRAKYSLDQEILGGAMVRIGSTIYDGSVKGSLERIRQQLSSN